uniref:Uncharacterized protein n=1 Tax=Romanomermis culicivorax TaxID=13658 RepID=A0A915KNJ2_ROMCU
MTSNAESVGIRGGSPWAIKRDGGASVLSVGRYDMTMLTSPVVFGIVDRYVLLLWSGGEEAQELRDRLRKGIFEALTVVLYNN